MRKNSGIGHLITALGGGVAFVCLALGLKLLSPELPAPVAAWVEDDRVWNGLILTLGGAFLSFLLGSGFVIAARRPLATPLKRIGPGGRPARLDNPPISQLMEAGTQLGRAGKELATLAANPKPGSNSLESLNRTVLKLRETIQQTEAIVDSINEIGGFPVDPTAELE